MIRIGCALIAGALAFGSGAAQAACPQSGRDLEAAAGWERAARQDLALAQGDAADYRARLHIESSAAMLSAQDAQDARERAAREFREAEVNRRLAAIDWAECR